MTKAPQDAGPSFYRSVLVMLFVFCLWFVLSFAGVTHEMEKLMAENLPAWLIWANLFLGPCACLIAGGPFRVAPLARLLAIMTSLLSIIVLEICFRRYLWPSAGALAVLLLEGYWIIPTWSSRRGKA